jgi:hypothetical protein
MRQGRPLPLGNLERDQMHQLAGSTAENRKAARRTLREAKAFRRLADLGVSEDLRLPAISNLHEAARLAITALATQSGW